MPELELCEQRSPEWYELRRGVVSASRATSLLTPAKRKTYARDLVAELLSIEPQPTFQSAAMEWGNEQEPHARTRYAFETGRQVQEVGFAWLDGYKGQAGCSPDGLVDGGAIEIKCQNSNTHIGYLLDGAPKDYVAQMQYQMMVLQVPWIDFVIYDPRLSPPADFAIHRINRDDKIIAELAVGTAATLKLVAEHMKTITGE